VLSREQYTAAMKFIRLFLLLACIQLECVSSFSVSTTAAAPPLQTDADVLSTRRGWLASTTMTVTAAVMGLSSPSSAAAASTAFTTFNDAVHGFSIQVPSSWQQIQETLMDRRTILVWTDPTDTATSLFIAYTPVRDDYTSLGSFGSVDQVAAQTILPKQSGKLMNENLSEDDLPQAKMLSAVSAKQAYIFDYIQQVGPIAKQQQSPSLTHFRTIFTLAQGATGGAGAVLVTITAQAPQDRYDAIQSTMDTIINSYGKSSA
jgi:PsbP